MHAMLLVYQAHGLGLPTTYCCSSFWMTLLNTLAAPERLGGSCMQGHQGHFTSTGVAANRTAHAAARHALKMSSGGAPGSASGFGAAVAFPTPRFFSSCMHAQPPSSLYLHAGFFLDII